MVNRGRSWRWGLGLAGATVVLAAGLWEGRPAEVEAPTDRFVRRVTAVPRHRAEVSLERLAVVGEQTAQGGSADSVGRRRAGLPVPPRAPEGPMAQRYPILLSPLRPARFDSGQSRPDRQRYALALRIYQRLGQQSDPWLQAVATDLSARCHAQLGEWSLALAMYDELARQFGEAVDGSGVPIDLGVAFRRAAIHQRMGASVEYVEGYLGAYEGLLGGRWSVSEAQRQRLTRYVRKTLSRYFANHGGEQRQRGRFEALRRREQQAALPGKGQKTL